MVRGILFCLLSVFSCTLFAQPPKRVLVNGIPVINPPEVKEAAIERSSTTRSASLLSAQQSQNLCGVTASFTPGVDSFFSESTDITFTSTSTNATSLSWMLNGMNYYGYTGSFTHYFQPGVYQVSLVAANGNCRDTATVTIVCTGSMPTESHSFSGSIGLVNNRETGTFICPANDGGWLVGGNTDYKTPNYSNGILVKLRKKHCIEWSTMLQNTMVSDACALRDGGFLVCGYMINDVNILIRVNSMGGVVWSKSFDFGPAEKFVNTGIRHVYEMSDGSLVASTSPFYNGFSVMKLDAQGNLLWDRFLRKETYAFDYTTSADILEWKNSLYVIGSFEQPDTVFNSPGPYTSFLSKIDPATGVVSWSNMYFLPEQRMSNLFKEIEPYDTGFLVTSIDFTTVGGGGVHPALHWLDTNGREVKGVAFTQSQYPPNFPVFMSGGALPGGNIFFHFASREYTGLQPPYFDRHYYLKVSDSTILGETLSGGGHIGSYKDGWAASVGTNYSQLLPWLMTSENIILSLRDSTMGDSDCSMTSSIFKGHGSSLTWLPVNWVKDTVLNVRTSSYPLQTADLYPQIRSFCPDYLDSCAVLKVTGQTSVCSLSDTYTYRAGRNSKCGQPVEWNYEGPMTMVKETDSSLTVRFSSFGTYKISARLRNSCNPAMDSMYVVAASKSAKLNLGPDTSICSGNSLVLHASHRFLAYEWKNGSTDSLLTVSGAGTYWVKVIDSCGNSMYDTVLISLKSPLPIDLGPDRAKCNADTLHLDAPSGFMNYSWSNNYNISSTYSQSVTVNPLVDTAYYIKAEKTPGCFGFDTIRVRVYLSPRIDLGADKSFCSGDSLQMDAGTGFSSYLWNGSNESRFKTVYSAGTYNVIGITADGCHSYDTLHVLNVWPLPQVNLDHNSNLCEGYTRKLNPGSFSTYHWQDGSTGATYAATGIGMYYVQVTDNHNCLGVDTTIISKILPLPSDFLPRDTALCSYSKITLRSSQSYSSYLWGNGSKTTNITIDKPGTYWLEVIDNNSCTGRDSIEITPKQCMEGVYIPTAFSPNTDYKNDVFRAMVFGVAKKFELTVYNRWGARVFYTTDYNKGWDGKVGGIDQRSDVYVWICRYQLEGGKEHFNRGTVTIVR